MTPLDTAKIESIVAPIFHATIALYWETHTAHWNIVSSDFHSLHSLFEGQYNDLWNALDAIAEGLRSLGIGAPSVLSGSTGITLGTNRASILSALIADHSAMISQIDAAIDALTTLGEKALSDTLVERLQSHQKMHWMLTSSL